MNRSNLIFCAGYLLLVIYASLFPFSGWSPPSEGIFSWFALKLPPQISKSDSLVNVLAYIPLGLLASRAFRAKRSGHAPYYLTCLIGVGLSFSMETLQSFLPNRVPSILDFLTNSIGTLIGAGLAVSFNHHEIRSDTISRWRRTYLLQGRSHDMGVLVICCWALSQLAPFAPTVDFGNIKNAIKPLWHTLHDLARFKPLDAMTYGCFIAALGVIAWTVARDKSTPIRIHCAFGAFTSIILCAKVFFYSRQLSLEALTGMAAGIVLASLLIKTPRRTPCYAAIALMIIGIVISEIKPGSSAEIYAVFNWMPFQYQIKNELTGFETIINGMWPFMALSYLFLLQKPRKGAMAIGGGVIFLGILSLEWHQLSLPGRTADVTQAVLAVAGWGAALVRPTKTTLLDNN